MMSEEIKVENNVSSPEPSYHRKYGSRTSALEVLKDVDLSGKTILITGTTAGIGTETARTLALRGAHVVMANRNLLLSEQLRDNIYNETDKHNIDIIHMDLSSLQSVQATAKEFISKGWPLHVLILNAGVLGSNTNKTIDGFEMTFGTNHLGHFSRLIPEPNEMAYKLYAYSKLCNVLFAFKLAREEKKNNIHTYVLHPGSMIATSISRSYGIFGKIGNALFKPFTKNLQQGAATTCYCAASPDVETDSGKYYESCWDDEKSLQKALARDEALQDALWNKSVELIKKYEEGQS